MAITQSQIADLVTATLFADKKKKVSNIDPNLLRNFVAGRRLVKKNQVEEHGGRAIRFNVNVEGVSTATAAGLYYVANRNAGDHLAQGTAELKILTNYFVFDELEEVFNSSEYEIVNYIKNREQNAMIDLMTRIEGWFWGTPASTSTTEPHGLEYILPYCSSAGFVGTYPSGYTSVYGIDPTVRTGWKSYGDQYTAVTEDDLILKMRTAYTKTNFEAPMDMMPIGDYKAGNQYGIYSNYQTIQEIENQLRFRNDSLGNDVAWEAGKATFRGTPIVEVAKLETNTRYPVFGVNWGLIKNHVQRGWWMKRKMSAPPNQPLVTAVDIFCVMEFATFDRRQCGWNIAKA